MTFSLSRSLFHVLAASTLVLSTFAVSASPALADPTPAPKEWTFLVYINGNNNLDSFGSLNMNQMEQIGSNAQLNIVTQWASYGTRKTTRMLIQKDNNTNKVTSPVLQDVSGVDMGDWNTLVDFINWGVTKYPAKHYFVAVWDHGSGWHDRQARSGIHTFDISFDDFTGHSITTAQLGQALAAGAKAIGHKIDVYGSDACLMAMAEVAAQVQESVNTFVGSEETEPGQGWPYPTFLSRWVANPTATPNQVGQYLAEEYVKAYSGGIYDTNDATFSAMDLNYLAAVKTSVANFGKELMTLNAAGRKSVMTAVQKSQNFIDSDYVDLGDFLLNLGSAHLLGASGNDAMATVKTAISQLVISNHDTANYAKATGLSIWLPSSKSMYNEYAALYGTLEFDRETHWGDALKYITQDK